MPICQEISFILHNLSLGTDPLHYYTHSVLLESVCNGIQDESYFSHTLWLNRTKIVTLNVNTRESFILHTLWLDQRKRSLCTLWTQIVTLNANTKEI